MRPADPAGAVFSHMREGIFMKFCMNCGTKLEEGDLFCRGCGAKIAQTPSAPADPYQGNQPSYADPGQTGAQNPQPGYGQPQQGASGPYGQAAGYAGGYSQGAQPGYGQGASGAQQGYSQGAQPGYGQGASGAQQGYSQGTQSGYTQGSPAGYGQAGGYSQGSPAGAGYGQNAPGAQQGYSQGAQSGYTQGSPAGYGQAGGYAGGYGGSSQPGQGGYSGSYSSDWNKNKTSKGPKAKNKAPKSSGKGGKKLGIIIASIVAALALCAVAAFALPGPKNIIMRTFSSPEKYYRYVEGRAVKEASDSTAAVYENIFRSNLNVDNRGMNYNIDVALSDQAKDLAAQYIESQGASGVDVNWMNSFGVSGRVDTKNGKSFVSAEALLNGSKILSGNMITDLNGNAVYGQVPEISPDYIAADLSTLGYHSYYTPAQALQIIRAIYNACPDEATAEKLMNKYMNAVIENLEEVEKSSKRLSAGNLSVNYTALDVTITAATAAKALKAVADLMENDDDLRSIFNQLLQAAGQSSPATYYDQLVQQMRSMAEQTAAYPSSESLLMTVYVDNSGEIRGRTISFGGSEVLRMAMPKKGSDVGVDIELLSDGPTFKITGEGTESKNSLSGNFSVTYGRYSDVYELLKVNVSGLDTESAKKGYINGSYSISPGRDFISAMTSEFGSSSVVSSLLTGISLDVDVSSSENKNSASIGVSYNGNSFGTVTVSLDTGDANDVQMISSAKTPERYVQDLDPSAFQAVISALKFSRSFSTPKDALPMGQ